MLLVRRQMERYLPVTDARFRDVGIRTPDITREALDQARNERGEVPQVIGRGCFTDIRGGDECLPFYHAVLPLSSLVRHLDDPAVHENIEVFLHRCCCHPLKPGGQLVMGEAQVARAKRMEDLQPYGMHQQFKSGTHISLQKR